MQTSRRLYFFTATFPYGIREVFIEDEINYLAKEFEKIVIVPLAGNGLPTRALPENCTLVSPIIRSRKMMYLKGLLLPLSLPVFACDFLKKRVYCKKARLKAWLIAYVQSNNLLASRTIKNILKKIKPNDVCYFYWGKGANVLSYFYRGKCHFVSRFHGEWDLWEESSGNYAPIRQQVTLNLDKAVFISQKGETYFQERYPYCTTSYIPLGTADKGTGKRSNDGVLRVVSCSTIYWLKRVDLIFEALCKIKGRQIEWHHIGIGPDADNLKEKVNRENHDNLSVVFVGRLKHEEVYDYYKTNEADVFVNASTNEGVPVSIMEAISFNIPVVATNVGGNSEVVTAETGVLVSANPTSQELAEAILKTQLLPLQPRIYWEKNYSAEKNYRKIAKLLNSL